MFRNRITSISQIIDVIKEYEKGATVEYLMDRFNLDSKDTFTVVFNYRFTFKKPNEFTNDELWELLNTPVPTTKGDVRLWLMQLLMSISRIKEL